jgi:hypothetical protein
MEPGGQLLHAHLLEASHRQVIRLENIISISYQHGGHVVEVQSQLVVFRVRQVLGLQVQRRLVLHRYLHYHSHLVQANAVIIAVPLE